MTTEDIIIPDRYIRKNTGELQVNVKLHYPTFSPVITEDEKEIVFGYIQEAFWVKAYEIGMSCGYDAVVAEGRNNGWAAPKVKVGSMFQPILPPAKMRNGEYSFEDLINLDKFMTFAHYIEKLFSICKFELMTTGSLNQLRVTTKRIFSL